MELLPMNLLLLKNAKECPACRCSGGVRHLGQCRHCGTVLFLSPINFRKYEDDGNLRTYWLFHQENGWMHRDQIMVRQEAQERFPDIKTPEPNNATTPEQVVRRGGKQIRRKLAT